MLRGAIEQVTRTHISGWLHSQSAPLRDQLVLAFIGDRCIGSGKVEIFREDLKEAKLGDGWAGFHFPVALMHGDGTGSVVVRLADSDLSLLQVGAKVSLP